MMQRLLRGCVQSTAARAKWTEGGSKDAIRHVQELDALMEDIESVFLEKEQVIVHLGIPVLTEYRMKWEKSYWEAIIAKHKIPADFTLYRACKERSNSIPMNPRSDFLDTWEIKPEHPFHTVMLGRVSETMTYGLLKSFEWYGFYCHLTGGQLLELRYIAGFVKKAGGSPYIVKRGDNSVIEDLKLFYNIQNIIECCLNICDLRFSLLQSEFKLITSKRDGFHTERINLDEVLDEVSLNIAVSPKVICERVKKYLTMTIRTAGAYAEEQATFDHGGITASDRKTTDSLTKIRFKGREYFEPYMQADAMRNSETEGRAILSELKLRKLQHLIDTYMHTSLIKTESSDFVRVGAFLQRLMSISGFGRALNFSSSPRSADPLPEDKHSLAEDVKNILIDLDKGALKRGMHPPVREKWIPTCIASWKSTSAGVAGVKAKITINGVLKSVRISKKTAVGAFLGPKAFSRAMLRERSSIERPFSVGFRDVPYKKTRAIYVIPLPTLCAQIAVVSHIVDYASTKGENNGLIDKRIDPSHFTTGSGSTSGIRVFDNIDTIRASGDMGVLAIGTDLSSFDAHCIEWNFRKPMVEALNFSGLGRTYGPEKYTQKEMVEYAFGEGIIAKSYWDNGREPIVYIQDEVLEKFSSLEGYITTEYVGTARPTYRTLRGAKTIEEKTIHIFDIDRAIEDKVNYPDHLLSVGVRMDGKDLVFLTSEASGEKSTLTMNTVVNLAMQRKALRALKKTEFGALYNPTFQKGVGDDAEWIGAIGIINSPEIINEAMGTLEKIYAEMGHIFSPSKTFLIPLSSEFVQTFARFGLYIFRDQIPVISSEKPRDVRNSIGFLNSFKSVLLAKLARGMNPDYAHLLYYLHQRKITELSLKRHIMRKHSPEFIDLKIPGAERVQIKVRNVSYVRESDRPTEIREKICVFRYTTAISYLPVSVGGGGLNPLIMGLVHSPAFFLQFLSSFERNFQEMMYGLYVFMANQPLNNGEVEDVRSSGRERVKLSEDFTPFSVEQLFSPAVRRNLDALKEVRIGRLGAENVPRQIMANGIMMEKFMHVETNFVREEYAEKVLCSLQKPLRQIKNNNDEWMLNFKFSLKECVEERKEHTFWVGLNDEYELLLRVYGLSTLGAKINGFADKLRMIISRDPVLRALRTPDEIIRMLDEFGVVSSIDREVGLLVLMRMGFEVNVANAIMDLRIQEREDNVQE